MLGFILAIILVALAWLGVVWGVNRIMDDSSAIEACMQAEAERDAAKAQAVEHAHYCTAKLGQTQADLDKAKTEVARKQRILDQIRRALDGQDTAH